MALRFFFVCFQDPQRKESSITLFNWLTKDDHGKHGSDIKHLVSISPKELVSLIDALSLSPLSKNLLDLIKLLYVLSWKVDPDDCEIAVNLERGKFQRALGKNVNLGDLAAALLGIRERFQVIIIIIRPLSV